MSIRRRSLCAALVAVLFAAGCGNSSSTGQPGGSGSESAPSAASSVPSSVPPGGSSSEQAETISGTVVAGVEPNCTLLQGDGKPHLLIFSDPAMKAKAAVGAMVTVVGTARPAQMTTCQQGTPFLVTAISPTRPGA
jgi:hypothetical protein